MAVCQVPCTCRCWYCCLQCSELLGAFYISIKHWETKDFFPKLEGILISISLPEPVSSSVLLLTKWSSVINPFFILRSAACYKPLAHQVSCWYPQALRPIHWCSSCLSNWYRRSATSYSCRNAALTLQNHKNKFGQCLLYWARDFLVVPNSSTVKCVWV